MLKLALAPSSNELTWDTIAGLMGLKIAQNNWKPNSKVTTARSEVIQFPSLDGFKLHAMYVEEMYDEAGKLPLLSMLLVDSVHMYPRKRNQKFMVIPQARLMQGREYKTDYSIVVMSENPVSYCLNIRIIIIYVYALSGKTGKEAHCVV